MQSFGWSLTLGVLILSSSCKHYQRNQSHAQVASESIEAGEQLAAVYCQSCHMLPDPSLLNAASWEKGVLPSMGPRLGIFNNGFQRYPSSRNDTNIGRRFYPSEPLLKPEEWQAIVDYYTSTSPDSLPGQKRPYPIGKGLSLFGVQTPSLRYEMPATSLVKIDTTAGNRGLFLFDIHYQNLYRLTPALQVADSVPDNGGVVDMLWQDSGWTLCNIGVLNPNNGKFGKIQRMSAGKSMLLDTMPRFGRLERPVQLAAADLNQDGKTDYVVCEFGNLVGALTWLENKGGNRYERHIIRAVPGAIRAYVGDYNHDGRPDIMALFAQGDEGIFLFTNKGGGQFSQETVLRFPPSYGSSYFELDDFNKDGFPDIVYTCGDNADYSAVLKPYHGVYIYLNDGHNHFAQKYFFPINGCYKAIARDFDGDGDLDLATISFFPDNDRQPEEGFVYLENRGGYDFRPYNIPETQRGKWLTMDAADLDGDGREDIVLGNFSFFTPVTKAGIDFKKGVPVMVLHNKGR
jgi:hypothetical protein